MLIEVFLSSAAGFCAKACDEFCDKNFSSKKAAITAAIIYPLALAALTSTTPLSSLFLALAMASIFAGKMDHYMHLFSLSLYTLAVLILPLQFFDLAIFSLFLASAFLDEVKIPFKCFAFLSKNRLFAPLAAFFIFLYSGQYIFLIALASFDMAYRAFKFLLKYRASPAPLPRSSSLEKNKPLGATAHFSQKEKTLQRLPSAFLKNVPAKTFEQPQFPGQKEFSWLPAGPKPAPKEPLSAKKILPSKISPTSAAKKSIPKNAKKGKSGKKEKVKKNKSRPKKKKLSEETAAAKPKKAKPAKEKNRAEEKAAAKPKKAKPAKAKKRAKNKTAKKKNASKNKNQKPKKEKNQAKGRKKK